MAEPAEEADAAAAPSSPAPDGGGTAGPVVSTATIIGSTVGDDFTSYQIQCTTDADKAGWAVHKRYSEFDKLRKGLKQSGVDIDGVWSLQLLRAAAAAAAGAGACRRRGLHAQ